MKLKQIHALPFDNDELVLKQAIDPGSFNVNQNGISTIFLDYAKKELPRGFDSVQLSVAIEDIPGLNGVDTQEYVFKFKKVAESELPRLEPFLEGIDEGMPKNHSAYKLEEIALG